MFSVGFIPQVSKGSLCDPLPSLLLIRFDLILSQMPRNKLHRTDPEMKVVEIVNVNYELEVTNDVSVNPISLP